MNLFIGDKKYKEEGLQLTQLDAACNFIENLSQDKLNRVDSEQSTTRCSTFK